MAVPATRQPTNLIPKVPEGFSRVEYKQLERLQNAEIARGLITATRLQAAATVASIGVQATAMLSREASFQADGDPALMNRLNYIADQFATYVGSEVARYGR